MPVEIIFGSCGSSDATGKMEGGTASGISVIHACFTGLLNSGCGITLSCNGDCIKEPNRVVLVAEESVLT